MSTSDSPSRRSACRAGFAERRLPLPGPPRVNGGAPRAGRCRRPAVSPAGPAVRRTHARSAAGSFDAGERIPGPVTGRRSMTASVDGSDGSAQVPPSGGHRRWAGGGERYAGRRRPASRFPPAARFDDPHGVVRCPTMDVDEVTTVSAVCPSTAGSSWFPCDRLGERRHGARVECRVRSNSPRRRPGAVSGVGPRPRRSTRIPPRTRPCRRSYAADTLLWVCSVRVEPPAAESSIPGNRAATDRRTCATHSSRGRPHESAARTQYSICSGGSST